MTEPGRSFGCFFTPGRKVAQRAAPIAFRQVTPVTLAQRAKRLATTVVTVPRFGATAITLAQRKG